MQWLIIIVVALMIWNSDWFNSDENYDAGYSDGYAEGYNTECKIRSTIIKGDWNNEDYSNGFADGRYDGVNACRSGN